MIKERTLNYDYECGGVIFHISEKHTGTLEEFREYVNYLLAEFKILQKLK